MHTLRDRLSVEEATDLAAQLPMLIRGFYYEGWNPSGKPTRLGNAQEFVAAVNKDFAPSEQEDYLEPEDITRAVLRVLASRVSNGEIDDVVHCLPEGLRELWEN